MDTTDLLEQEAQLKAQLDAIKAQKKELGLVGRRRTPVDPHRDEHIAEVRALCEKYNLTRKDVFPVAVKAKYKHPETGATWSGRGFPPVWVKEMAAQGRLPQARVA